MKKLLSTDRLWQGGRGLHLAGGVAVLLNMMVLMALLLTIGCGSDGRMAEDPMWPWTGEKWPWKGDDVYVAMVWNSLYRGNAYDRTAMVTKNGIAYEGTNFEYAVSLAVTDNNDVYAAGFYQDYTYGAPGGEANQLTYHPNDATSNNASKRAILWNKGEWQALAPNNSQATGIAVSGNDTYVVGYDHSGNAAGGTRYAVLWTNGVRQQVPTIGTMAHGFTVFASGDGNVYVGGTEGSSSINTTRYGFIWKVGDEIATRLSVPPDSNATARCQVSSVYVSNSIVYAAGITNTPNASGTPVAARWVDGVGKRLETTPGALQSEARSIFVTDNGDVYVVGYERLNVLNLTQTAYEQRDIAVLWKNDDPPVHLAETKSNANSVVVTRNGDVYIVGREGGATSNTAGGTSKGYATIWKNGEKHRLHYIPSEAYAVVVK